MAIKAIIFDCFGVLTNDGWLAFRNKYFFDNGKLLEEANELNKLSDAGVISLDTFISRISVMADVSEEVTKNSLKIHVRNDKLIDYIKTELKGEYKIGLLSNASSNFLDEVIGQDGVNLFDEIVLSYQVRVAKPDKLMYETIVQKLGLKYEECLFIDDQPRYCEGARALGIKTIVYENNRQLIDKLRHFLEVGTNA